MYTQQTEQLQRIAAAALLPTLMGGYGRSWWRRYRFQPLAPDSSVHTFVEALALCHVYRDRYGKDVRERLYGEHPAGWTWPDVWAAVTALGKGYGSIPAHYLQPEPAHTAAPMACDDWVLCHRIALAVLDSGSTDFQRLAECELAEYRRDPAEYVAHLPGLPIDDVSLTKPHPPPPHHAHRYTAAHILQCIAEELTERLALAVGGAA